MWAQRWVKRNNLNPEFVDSLNVFSIQNVEEPVLLLQMGLHEMLLRKRQAKVLHRQVCCSQNDEPEVMNHKLLSHFWFIILFRNTNHILCS